MSDALKETVLLTFLRGHDVFVLFQLGTGKAFVMLRTTSSLRQRNLRTRRSESIVIVVSPLFVLMKDAFCQGSCCRLSIFRRKV